MRLKSLESLRGIMASWVVLTHVAGAAGLPCQKWPWPFSLVGQGNLAVDVFIILSGFVIFLLLDQKQESYRVFMTRRVFRLFPVYWVCLGLSIPLLPVSIEALRSLPWQDTHNVLQLKFFQDTLDHFYLHLGLHLFLLQGLFDWALQSSSVAFIGPAWSLSVEWQFYLLAPILFYGMTRKNQGWMRSAWLWPLLIAVLIAGESRPFDLGVMPGKLQFFLVGMTSYLFWSRRKGILERFPPNAWVFPISIFLLTVFTQSLPLVIWATIFFSLVSMEPQVDRGGEYCGEKPRLESAILWVLERAPLLALGRISYSVYLSHMPILYGIMRLMAEFMAEFHLAQKTYFGVLLVSTFTVTVAVSTCLYHLVEKPFIHWGNQLAGTVATHRKKTRGQDAATFPVQP